MQKSSQKGRRRLSPPHPLSLSKTYSPPQGGGQAVTYGFWCIGEGAFNFNQNLYISIEILTFSIEILTFSIEILAFSIKSLEILSFSNGIL